MKNVYILACENVWGMGLMFPKDFFQIANLVIQKQTNTQTLGFRAQIISETLDPIKSANGSWITPDQTLDQSTAPDIIIIPPIRGDNISETLSQQKKSISWLQRQDLSACKILSLTTGSFLLAESGLLDDQPATTHWAFAKHFKKRYPRVNFQQHQTVNFTHAIFCAGTTQAGFNLLVFLTQELYGENIARQCALLTYLETPQSRDSIFMGLLGKKQHGDKDVLIAQEWLEQHYAKALSIAVLARQMGMSDRNFKRRFRQATGESPLHYLQHIRIERAKILLATTDQTLHEIVRAVGYNDLSYFRNLFKRRVLEPPSQYRKRIKSEINGLRPLT